MTFDNDKQLSGPHGPKLVEKGEPKPLTLLERWAGTIVIALLITAVALVVMAL